MLCRFKPVVAALGAAALLLSSSPGAFAQAQVVRPIVSNHDFDSATVTYALLSESRPVIGDTKIKTTGSSATVVAAGAGTPFADVAAGDEITVQPAGGANTAVVFYVLARASGTSITADRAVNLSGNGATGYSFTFRHLVTGTAADVGWFPVGGYTSRTIHFWIPQLAVASGSLAVKIDCKASSPWAVPTPVYPPASGTGQCWTGLFTVAGATARCAFVLAVEEKYSACRFGVSLTDDGNDLTTNLEQVTAIFEASR